MVERIWNRREGGPPEEQAQEMSARTGTLEALATAAKSAEEARERTGMLMKKTGGRHPDIMTMTTITAAVERSSPKP